MFRFDESREHNELLNSYQLFHKQNITQATARTPPTPPLSYINAPTNALALPRVHLRVSRHSVHIWYQQVLRAGSCEPERDK